MNRRLYIAPFGLWLTLDSSAFSAVEISKKRKAVDLDFEESGQGSVARLRIEQPATIADVGKFRPRAVLKIEQGAYVKPTDSSVNVIHLVEEKR
jgi:hypothetical protein